MQPGKCGHWARQEPADRFRPHAVAALKSPRPTQCSLPAMSQLSQIYLSAALAWKILPFAEEVSIEKRALGSIRRRHRDTNWAQVLLAPPMRPAALSLKPVIAVKSTARGDMPARPQPVSAPFTDQRGLATWHSLRLPPICIFTITVEINFNTKTDRFQPSDNVCPGTHFIG